MPLVCQLFFHNPQGSTASTFGRCPTAPRSRSKHAWRSWGGNKGTSGCQEVEGLIVLLSRGWIHLPPKGKRKIIDSKVPFLMGYVSSLKGNYCFLLVDRHLFLGDFSSIGVKTQGVLELKIPVGSTDDFPSRNGDMSAWRSIMINPFYNTCMIGHEHAPTKRVMSNLQDEFSLCSSNNHGSMLPSRISEYPILDKVNFHMITVSYHLSSSPGCNPLPNRSWRSQANKTTRDTPFYLLISAV